MRSGNSFAITAKRVGVWPEGPEAGPGTDIVLDGNRFSYKRSVTTPDYTLVIAYTGIVSGDTFIGTVDLGGLAEAPYTGTRIKSDGKTARRPYTRGSFLAHAAADTVFAAGLSALAWCRISASGEASKGEIVALLAAMYFAASLAARFGPRALGPNREWRCAIGCCSIQPGVPVTPFWKHLFLKRLTISSSGPTAPAAFAATGKSICGCSWM